VKGRRDSIGKQFRLGPAWRPTVVRKEKPVLLRLIGERAAVKRVTGKKTVDSDAMTVKN
jgi:hypothetical protein